VLAHVALAPSAGANDPPVIRTASAVQARAPVHGRSVGNARRYARWLDPLRAALAE